MNPAEIRRPERTALLIQPSKGVVYQGCATSMDAESTR